MKENFNEAIDKKISDCLKYKAEKISATDDMLFKIQTNIRKNNKLEIENIKVKFFKVKTIMIIAILCIGITLPCIGDTHNINWFSQDEVTNGIGELPTAETVKKELGYLPKYSKNLVGEFKVKSFKIINNPENDGNSEKVTNKTGEFEYTRDGSSESQYLKIKTTMVNKEYSYDDIQFPQEVYKSYYNNTTLYWGSMIRKEVPKYYAETKEDLDLIKEGKLEIAFSGNKINVSEISYVLWYDDGIQYVIMNKGYDNVYSEDMINMAKSIINQ